LSRIRHDIAHLERRGSELSQSAGQGRAQGSERRRYRRRDRSG
jgi:hypothetical protein